MKKLYRLDDVEIEPFHREARRDGHPLRLRPKAFDLLMYLIAHRDRTLSKEELLEQIWQGVNVTENSLTQCVIELRKGLGDDARQPRFIKTVAKTGYRFIGPVEEIVSPDVSGPVMDEQVPVGQPEPPRSLQRSWVGLAGAGLFAVVVLLTALWARPTAAKSSSAPRPFPTQNLDAYRYYSLGVEKARQFHAKEAIALFEKAVSLDPQFAMAHARIGYAYAVSWSKPIEAKPHLDRAFQLADQLRDQDRLYLAAWHAQANYNYEAAIRAYRELLTRYPEESEAYQQLGTLYIGEERYDDASNIIGAALKVDPASAQAYNVLSSIYLATSRFDEAVAAAQRFVALSPSEPNAYDTLGLAYEARGDFEKAENLYRAAIRLQPDFEIAFFHLGNALFRMGRYREALEQFQRVTQIAASVPDQQRGYAQIMELFRRQRNFSKAQEAGAKVPSYAIETVLLALDRNDLKRAAQLLSQQPETGDRGRRMSQRFRLYAQGQLAMATGDVQGALSYFRQTLETRTPFWAFDWYEDCLADAYLKAGLTDQAIVEYQRVLTRFPSLALVWYHLGQAYERKGSIDLARQATGRFLELWKNADPDIPELQATRKTRRRLL